MSCGTCKWASFERTPTGRIKKNMHGTCRYPPTVEPTRPGCENMTTPWRSSIWPNSDYNCPVYEPAEAKP